MLDFSRIQSRHVRRSRIPNVRYSLFSLMMVSSLVCVFLGMGGGDYVTEKLVGSSDAEEEWLTDGAARRLAEEERKEKEKLPPAWLPPSLAYSSADEVVGALQIVMGFAAIIGVAYLTYRRGMNDGFVLFFVLCLSGMLAVLAGTVNDVEPLAETLLHEIESAQIFRSVCLWLGVVLPVGSGIGWFATSKIEGERLRDLTR